jgi:hypothetical protein
MSHDDRLRHIRKYDDEDEDEDDEEEEEHIRRQMRAEQQRNEDRDDEEERQLQMRKLRLLGHHADEENRRRTNEFIIKAVSYFATIWFAILSYVVAFMHVVLDLGIVQLVFSKKLQQSVDPSDGARPLYASLLDQPILCKKLTSFTLPCLEALIGRLRPGYSLYSRRASIDAGRLVLRKRKGRTPKLSVEDCVLGALLWYTQSSGRKLDSATRLNSSKSSIHEDADFVALLTDIYLSDQVRWPTARERQAHSAAMAPHVWGLTGCVGFLDSKFFFAARELHIPASWLICVGFYKNAQLFMHTLKSTSTKWTYALCVCNDCIYF